MDIQNEFYDRLTSEQVIAFKNELQRLLEIMDHTIPLQDRREELQRFVVKYFLAGIHFNTIETVRLIVKKTNMSAEQISEVTLLPLDLQSKRNSRR